MTANQSVDVGAILSAAYLRPDSSVDQVAERVRARLALMETVAEGVRLLFGASGSALVASLGEVNATADDAVASRGDDCGKG